MYEAALDVKTKNVLAKIQGLEVLKNFYLAGGTALALQLGHRRSIDLDFFSHDYPSHEQLVQALAFHKPTIIQQDKETLNTLVDDVKVSFLGYPYPLLKETIHFQKIKLADILDIACMKLIAIAQRGTKKDFVDMYVILQKYSLDELLKEFEEKYRGVNYQRLHILKSLVYFTDADSDPEPDYLIPINWQKVKQFLTSSAL